MEASKKQCTLSFIIVYLLIVLYHNRKMLHVLRDIQEFAFYCKFSYFFKILI